jgi:hypothetical protein
LGERQTEGIQLKSRSVPNTPRESEGRVFKPLKCHLLLPVRGSPGTLWGRPEVSGDRNQSLDLVFGARIVGEHAGDLSGCYGWLGTQRVSDVVSRRVGKFMQPKAIRECLGLGVGLKGSRDSFVTARQEARCTDGQVIATARGECDYSSADLCRKSRATVCARTPRRLNSSTTTHSSLNQLVLKSSK